MTEPDLGGYSERRRKQEVEERLDNYFAKFDLPGDSKNSEVGSTSSGAISAQQNCTDVSQDCQMLHNATDDHDIQTFQKQSFLTFLQKFQITLDTEVDVQKMNVKYLELAKKAYSAFQVLCSVKEGNFQEKIDVAADDLKLKFYDQWKTIEKQHYDEIGNIEQCVHNFERTYKDLVKAAVENFFDSPSAKFSSALTQAKFQAEASELATLNAANKFRPMLQESITSCVDAVDQQARLVHGLVFNFKAQMDKKLTMFICLSESEFSKTAVTYSTNAVNALTCTDPEFRSLFVRLMSKMNVLLQKRNTAVLNSESSVAFHAMEYTKQWYTKKMELFCNTTGNATSLNIFNFHLKLSNAGLQYFKDGCNFHDCSGIDVHKYISELSTSLNNMLEPFVEANLTKNRKASLSADLKKRADQKEAEEKAEKERLRQIEEQKRREAETQRQAELKKQRQETAVRKEKDKIKSASQNAETVGISNAQSTQWTSVPESGIYTAAEATAIPGIAIEFGVKFIRVGYMHPIDGPKNIQLEDQTEAMPAVIGVDKDKFVFGTAALAHEQQISFGDMYQKMSVNHLIPIVLENKETRFRLEELTALLLIYVKQKCEAFLRQEIPDAILIIPSWFNHELRLGTKHAAELAGFSSSKLISEAGAVALGWWWKNKSTLNRLTRLLVAVASDFGFDAAGFEIDSNTVVMKTIVNSGNLDLGRKNLLGKVHKYYSVEGNAAELVDDALADLIVQQAVPYSWLNGKEADHCIFLKTRGYEGSLGYNCLGKYCKGTSTNTDKYGLLGGTIYTIEGRSKCGDRLKEALLYTLSYQHLTKEPNKICENGVALGGNRKFEVDLNRRNTPITHVNVLETVAQFERHLGQVHVVALPDSMEEVKKFNLNFVLNPEGILSVESKFGHKSAVASFNTNNLAPHELSTSKAKIQHFLDSKGSGIKPRQKALHNLIGIEQDLRKHVKESSKILEILKPAIIKEIEKTIAPINDTSMLAEIQYAITKLGKYSEKYIKN